MAGRHEKENRLPLQVILSVARATAQQAGCWRACDEWEGGTECGEKADGKLARFNVAGEMWLGRAKRQESHRRLCVWPCPRTEKSGARTEFAAFCSLLLNLLFATDAVISTSTDIDNRYVCYSISCSSPSTPQQQPLLFPPAASPTRFVRTARARHTSNQTLSRAHPLTHLVCSNHG
jgi:hypothetical protein